MRGLANLKNPPPKESKARVGSWMSRTLRTYISIADTPFLAPPWWTPPSIIIASSKELAINQHNTTIQNSTSQGFLPIYTDGSGINGKIGASAVTTSISDQAYLGPDTQYTVFASELYGIHLALHIAYFITQIEKKRNIQTPIIFTDNQAALRRILTPNSSGPGQSIMRKIISQIELLQHQQISIELHWIPAHKNLEGNEAADRAAKSATGWRLKHKRNGRAAELNTGITAAKANNVPIQKVPVHTTLARLAASDWATNWSHDNHGKELQNIAPRPSRAILKLHTNSPKASAHS